MNRNSFLTLIFLIVWAAGSTAHAFNPLYFDTHTPCMYSPQSGPVPASVQGACDACNQAFVGCYSTNPSAMDSCKATWAQCTALADPSTPTAQSTAIPEPILDQSTTQPSSGMDCDTQRTRCDIQAQTQGPSAAQGAACDAYNRDNCGTVLAWEIKSGLDAQSQAWLDRCTAVAGACDIHDRKEKAYLSAHQACTVAFVSCVKNRASQTIVTDTVLAPSGQNTPSPTPSPTPDCSEYQAHLDRCQADLSACQSAKAQGQDVQDCGPQFAQCVAQAKQDFPTCVSTGMYQPTPDTVNLTKEKTHIVNIDDVNRQLNEAGTNGTITVIVQTQDGQKEITIGFVTALDGTRYYTADGIHYSYKMEDLTNPNVFTRLIRWSSQFGESLFNAGLRASNENTLKDVVADNALTDFKNGKKDFLDKVIEFAKGQSLGQLSSGAPTGADFSTKAVTTMFTELQSDLFRKAFKRYADIRQGGRDAPSILNDPQDPLGELQILLHVGQGNPLKNKQIFANVMENTYQRYDVAKNDFNRGD